MTDSVFTKIIKREIPGHIIYEDEKTLAFLDIHPATEGHTLVVPKTQIEFLWDLPDDDYQALMATVKKVGTHLRQHAGKLYVGELVVGTDVPHAHVHVIPFDTPHELKRPLEAATAEPDHEALARVREKLSFS